MQYLHAFFNINRVFKIIRRLPYRSHPRKELSPWHTGEDIESIFVVIARLKSFGNVLEVPSFFS